MLLTEIRPSNPICMPVQRQVANAAFGAPCSYGFIIETGDKPPIVAREEPERTNKALWSLSSDQKKTQKSRTEFPENLRITGKLFRSEPDPSEVISQYLTIQSPPPLINPLPSGVNSTHRTPLVCPGHFATRFCLRESHIQSEPFQ